MKCQHDSRDSAQAQTVQSAAIIGKEELQMAVK
jgi:hypothetical protein